MRIVQINGGAKGSTGKIMMGIAEVARAQGHTLHLCRGKKTSLPCPVATHGLAAGQCNMRQHTCIGAREEETCKKSAIGTCQEGWPRIAPWWR